MPLDPTQNAKLDALVADLKVKEQALADASDKNDADQATAQAAVATAAGSQQAKSHAHDDLSASVDAIVAFVNSLKG